MFGLPIVLAALALMGAPASLSVGCNPAVAERGASASTYFIPYTTTPVRIEFGGMVCGGLVWLAASPAERVKIRALNPSVDFDRWAGVALVVVLHEARHGAGDRGEASAECHAMQQLGSFAAAWAPAGDLAVIVAQGRVYDAGLPASYHEASC